MTYQTVIYRSADDEVVEINLNHDEYYVEVEAD